MKVYLLEKGKYSDYRILGVFSGIGWEFGSR